MPSVFASVWTLIGSAMDDGRIISPREVLNELTQVDDDVARWVKQHPAAFVDPTEEVQREAGTIYAQIEARGRQHRADPFVIADAKLRGLTVVTYEGRTFSGVPTRNWQRTIPGICQHFNVPCCTLGEALAKLGGSFA
jgi:hypothetical protein